MLKRTLAALAVASAVAFPSAAQEPPADWDPGYGDRFLQTASPLVNDQGLFQVLFSHRFNQAVNRAGGNELGGLDSGANIGIGLGYAPMDRLAVEVLRASTGGDYEFAARYTVLKPTKELPVAVGVRGGLDWETKGNLDKKTAGFGQAIVAVTLGERFTLGAAPTYVSSTPLFTDVWNVPLMAQVKVARGLYVTGEYVFRNRDLAGSKGQWSVAIEKSLFRHRFSVWVGNSGGLTVDQIMAADYGGGVLESNLRLGFNLVRQFEIGKKP